MLLGMMTIPCCMSYGISSGLHLELCSGYGMSFNCAPVDWMLMSIWISFVVIKVMLGVHLVSYATRRREGMEAREAEDVVNDFGRDPIGEGKEEQVRFLEIINLTVFQELSARSTIES